MLKKILVVEQEKSSIHLQSRKPRFPPKRAVEPRNSSSPGALEASGWGCRTVRCRGLYGPLLLGVQKHLFPMGAFLPGCSWLDTPTGWGHVQKSLNVILQRAAEGAGMLTGVWSRSPCGVGWFLSARQPLCRYFVSAVAERRPQR